MLSELRLVFKHLRDLGDDNENIWRSRMGEQLHIIENTTSMTESCQSIFQHD